MTAYELYIECKACREGNHNNCSQRADSDYHSVTINCTCTSCKKESKSRGE